MLSYADGIDPTERKKLKSEGRIAGVVSLSRWEEFGSSTQV